MKAGTVVLFTLFLPILAGPPVEAAEVSHGQRIWQMLYDWYDLTHEADAWSDVIHEADAVTDSQLTPATIRHFDIMLNKSRMDDIECSYKIELEDLLELGELKEHYQLEAEEFKDFISKFEKFKDFISNFEGDDFKIFIENYTQEAKATVKVMKALKEKTLDCLAQALGSLALGQSSLGLGQNCPRDCLGRALTLSRALNSLTSRAHSHSMNPMAPSLGHSLALALDSPTPMDSPMDSLAVESTKRQRSIIFGLTTLTTFSGLALLLFWILEEQKKKSRTNIKA